MRTGQDRKKNASVYFLFSFVKMEGPSMQLILLYIVVWFILGKNTHAINSCNNTRAPITPIYVPGTSMCHGVQTVNKCVIPGQFLVSKKKSCGNADPGRNRSTLRYFLVEAKYRAFLDELLQYIVVWYLLWRSSFILLVHACYYIIMTSRGYVKCNRRTELFSTHLVYFVLSTKTKSNITEVHHK